MDLGKYIPAAFASQVAGQLAASGPSAYPLPPVPEKFEAGLAALEHLAELRGDDLIDGGTLRMSDPLYALQPVTDIGAQYAEGCTAFLASEPVTASAQATSGAEPGAADVDDLLLQVMPDREKIGRPVGAGQSQRRCRKPPGRARCDRALSSGSDQRAASRPARR